MRLALDTNRYRDYFLGMPEAREPIRTASEVYIPFIVLGELRSGFLKGRQPRRNEEGLSRFLRQPRVHVLLPDPETSHFYAELLVELQGLGTPIPTNDLWIAALVWQHNLTLFTRDRHFERVTRIAKI